MPEEVTFTVDFTALKSSSVNNLELLTSAEKRDLIPELGYLLKDIRIELLTDDTVLSLSERAFRSNKIPYEKQNFGFGTYIEGIQLIYENDAGPGSGWTFEVNGFQPQTASNAYYLRPGDRLVWRFVLGD